MANLYARLFRYKQSPSISPLENFLTEALADLIERMDPGGRIDFLSILIPETARSAFRAAVREVDSIRVSTQHPIKVFGTTKFPDLIVFYNDHPIFLIEVKVAANEQRHVVTSASFDGDGVTKPDRNTQGQLRTYTDWMAANHLPTWSGCVVFLTHKTAPPDGFLSAYPQASQPVCVTAKWRDLAAWLHRYSILNELHHSPDRTLISDFQSFLREQGLMTEYATSKDFAAAETYMSSHAAFQHSIDAVMAYVSESFPKLKGGHFHSEFSSGLGVFWNWFYINRQLSPTPLRPYLAFGIRFPNIGEFMKSDPEKVPQHEPYFFLLFGDDGGTRKISTILSSTPSNWSLVWEDVELIASIPLSKVSPEPDERIAELKEWARLRADELNRSFGNISSVSVDLSELEASK